MHSTPAGTSTSTSPTTNTARPITPGRFQDSRPQSQSREPSTTPATRTTAGHWRSPTHFKPSNRDNRCRNHKPEPYGASISAESNGRPVSRAKTTGSGHHKESSTCTSLNNGDTCTSEALNNPTLNNPALCQPGRLRLLLRMIAASHQRSTLHMLEAHCQRLMLQKSKLLRGVIARHRQMIPRRPQILPHRQNIHLPICQITKDREQLVHLLAHPHNDASL